MIIASSPFFNQKARRALGYQGQAPATLRKNQFKRTRSAQTLSKAFVITLLHRYKNIAI